MAARWGCKPVDEDLARRVDQRFLGVHQVYRWLWDLKQEYRNAKFWAEHYRVMKSKRWRELRKKVYQIQGGKCKECSKRLGKSGWQCHHLHYRTLGREAAADVVVLCEPRHEKQHEPPLPDDLAKPYEVGSKWFSDQELFCAFELEGAATDDE